MRAPSHNLAVGDRAPNFVLPVASGKFQMFYDQVKGRPVALVFAPGAPLAALVSLAGPLADAGVDLFCVNVASPAENLAGDLPFPVWSDREQKISAAYFNQSGTPWPPRADHYAAFLLDANQRILAIECGEPEGVVARTSALYGSLPQPEPPEVRPSNAPVLLMPNLLSPEMCRDLIEMWDKGGHDESTVGRVAQGDEQELVYHQAKSRLDHRIMDPQVNRALQMTLGRRIAPELEKAFHFEGFRFDRFLVVCYDAARGDRFRPHRDNTSPTTADRRFALTLNLNTEGYVGGELVFPEYGPHKYRPESGGAVIFSCSLIHEALPVVEGRRFALLTFLRALPGQGAG